MLPNLKEKCISDEVERIGSMIIFHLSKHAMKSQDDAIFLVRLQGKSVEIDHSWGVKGLKTRDRRVGAAGGRVTMTKRVSSRVCDCIFEPLFRPHISASSYFNHPSHL